MAGVLWPMAAKRAWITSTALLSCLAALLHGSPAAAQAPDLLSFAQGAVALRVEADAAAGVTIEQALRAIDGPFEQCWRCGATMPGSGGTQ